MRIGAGFSIICLYICCNWRSSYQEGSIEILLTGLSPPHVCAFPKPRPRFPTYVMAFFVFNSVRLNFVCFVDSGRIVDHYRLLKAIYRYHI